MTYELNEGQLGLDEREANYQIMIRTREKEGLIWTISNRNGLEFTTLEVSDMCSVSQRRTQMGTGENPWHTQMGTGKIPHRTCAPSPLNPATLIVFMVPIAVVLMVPIAATSVQRVNQEK